MSRIVREALRRVDLLKLADRLGQRERAAGCLVDAPFEQGAQQLLLFDAREPCEIGRTRQWKKLTAVENSFDTG